MGNELLEMHKPNGVIVKVNKESIEAAKALGWSEGEPRTKVNLDIMTKQQLVDYAESEFSVFLDVTHTAKRLKNKITDLMGD